MLSRVSAIEFVRAMNSGRTSPLIVNCERADGAIVTAVVKFSDFCELREAHLVREVIGACLAGDLRLPVSEPLLVEISNEWPDLIPDQQRRLRVAASNRVAFGSVLMTGGYSTWTPDTRITEGQWDTALEVFVFDAIIQNPDRRSDNPNCFVRGEEIRIFDHELAFAHGLMLGWRPPWAAGGLNWLETKGKHIFRADLKRSSVDLAQVQKRWEAVTDARLAEYRLAIPLEWNNAGAAVDAALSLIRDARNNIVGCMEEIRRVLS